MKFVLFMIAFAWALGARAEIDPSTGFFSSIAVDDMKKVGTLSLDFRRFYRSQFQQVGFFGRGWCGVLDDRLTVEEGVATLRTCVDAREESFEKLKDGRFRAVQPKGDSLAKVNGGFKYEESSGITRLFNDDGRPERIALGKDWLTIRYSENGRPLSILTSSGDTISIQASSTGLIKQVRGQKIGLDYEYEDDRLVMAKSGLRVTKYQYDGEKRLVKLERGTQSQLIKYQTGGMVDSITHDGCEERLSYKRKGTEVQTKVDLVCGEKTKATREYQTQFSPDEKRIVSQIQIEGTSRREIQFHEKFNVPVKIIDGRGTTTYLYDRWGRMTLKKTGDVISSYDYDKKGRLQSFRSLRGKVAQHWVKYQYSNVGQLKHIESSMGKFVVVYDKKGGSQIRIAERSTQARLRTPMRRPANLIEIENLAELQKLTEPLEELKNFRNGIY